MRLRRVVPLVRSSCQRLVSSLVDGHFVDRSIFGALNSNPVRAPPLVAIEQLGSSMSWNDSLLCLSRYSMERLRITGMAVWSDLKHDTRLASNWRLESRSYSSGKESAAAGDSSLLEEEKFHDLADDDLHQLQEKNEDEKGSSVTKPRSLALDENSPLRVVDPPPEGFSGMALKLLGFYSKESQLIRGSRTLYSRISTHCEKPELYASFVLEKNFRTTHAMLLLHMWLTLVRLRAEGKDGAKVGQSMYELFNHDLEQRIAAAGVKMLISKWMKELEKNFYGAVAAYDTAMRPTATHDELARALWRNVYAEDDPLMPTGTTAAPVKSLARYVRREAACLALTERESLLSGNIVFTSNFAVGPFIKTPESLLEQGPVKPMPA